MKKLFFALVVSTLFFTAQAGANTVYTFNDNWIDWPGYDSNHSHNDDYGTPQIDSMSVTLNDAGILQQIDIALEGSTRWQEFNSLFINSYSIESNNSQWDDWDYFAHDGGSTHGNLTNGRIPDDGIFSVNKGGYDYTMTKNRGNIRRRTPNGIDDRDLTLAGNNGDGGWKRTSSYLLSYSFEGIDGLEIDLSQGFFIAFAPYCANDVIGGGMNPVPEPTTMALLGIGLIGLARIGRKKYMK